MGVHVSKGGTLVTEEEKKRNKRVEKLLFEEQRRTENEFKLLLLGMSRDD